MMYLRLTLKDLLRGNLSLPAVVFIWAGLWNIMDIDVPGGTGLWKELALATFGTLVMIWTQTFFSNAGMDSWDGNGIIMRLRGIMRREKMSKREMFILYSLSLVAMAGSIIFWDGVYTIFEQHVWDESVWYHMVCAAVGGIGVVWIWTSEEEHETVEDCSGEICDDQRDEEYGEETKSQAVRSRDGSHVEVGNAHTNGNGHANGNSHANGNGHANGHVNNSGGKVERGETMSAPHVASDPAMLPPLGKVFLYAKGFVGNILGIVFWFGLEHIITDQSPDSVWTGFVSYIVGIVLLMFIGRWKENCGLDSDEENDRLAVISSHVAPGDEIDSGDTPRLPPPSARGNGQEEWRLEASDEGPRFCWPAWVTTTLEIVGVVAAWTGVEWYNWEDDYIPRTWYRDPLYIIVGLAVLAATGTLLELSGTPLGGVSRRKTETIPTSVLLRRISSFALGSLHSPCKNSQSERQAERGSAAAPIGPRRGTQHVAS